MDGLNTEGAAQYFRKNNKKEQLGIEQGEKPWENRETVVKSFNDAYTDLRTDAASILQKHGIANIQVTLKVEGKDQQVPLLDALHRSNELSRDVWEQLHNAQLTSEERSILETFSIVDNGRNRVNYEEKQDDFHEELRDANGSVVETFDPEGVPVEGLLVYIREHKVKPLVQEMQHIRGKLLHPDNLSERDKKQFEGRLQELGQELQEQRLRGVAIARNSSRSKYRPSRSVAHPQDRQSVHNRTIFEAQNINAEPLRNQGENVADWHDETKDQKNWEKAVQTLNSRRTFRPPEKTKSRIVVSEQRPYNSDGSIPIDRALVPTQEKRLTIAPSTSRALITTGAPDNGDVIDAELEPIPPAPSPEPSPPAPPTPPPILDEAERIHILKMQEPPVDLPPAPLTEPRTPDLRDVRLDFVIANRGKDATERAWEMSERRFHETMNQNKGLTKIFKRMWLHARESHLKAKWREEYRELLIQNNNSCCEWQAVTDAADVLNNQRTRRSFRTSGSAKVEELMAEKAMDMDIEGQQLKTAQGALFNDIRDNLLQPLIADVQSGRVVTQEEMQNRIRAFVADKQARSGSLDASYTEFLQSFGSDEAGNNADLFAENLLEQAETIAGHNFSLQQIDELIHCERKLEYCRQILVDK